MKNNKYFLVSLKEKCMYSYQNRMEFTLEEAVLLKYFANITIKIKKTPTNAHIKRLEQYITEYVTNKVTISIPALNLSRFTLYFAIKRSKEPIISFRAHTWEGMFYSIYIEDFLKKVRKGYIKIEDNSLDFLVLLYNFPRDEDGDLFDWNRALRKRVDLNIS